MQPTLFIFLVAAASAATLISITPNYTISFQKSYDELAHIYYDQKLNQHGMNYLYVYGNSAQSLLDQHRGAGFLQGYATFRQIQAAYINFNKFKLNSAALKPKLVTFLSNQIDFIQSMAQRFPRDLYWQYAYAYLQQCRYAYRGFLQRLHEQKRLDLYIGFSQFYYLTNVGDLRELIPAYNTDRDEIAERSCTIFVKKTEQDIYVSHSTGSYYPFMIRIIKSYNFPTRDPNVVSQTVTFSSRPGDFSSKDSYYLTSSGLKITETSFINFDKGNFADLNVKSVPSWIRSHLAASLARSGNEWIDYYSKFSSGTHSAQWIIIDHRKFYEDKNFVMFYQQAFSLIRVTDVTMNITRDGYVASYNVPLNRQIYDKLKYQQFAYDYQTDPSAIALKRYNTGMNNEEQIKYWMYINQESDPSVGIAPRGDLADPPNGYGLIDCKVSSLRTDSQNFFWVRSSPTTSNGRFQPFTWKTLPNITHEGMPTEFNFEWQKVPLDYEKWLQQKSETNLLSE